MRTWREYGSMNADGIGEGAEGLVPELVRIGALSAYAELPRAISRPPILLIHGILATGWYFEKYQRALAALGYPTYAVNLRGRAESRRVASVGRITMAEFVD